MGLMPTKDVCSAQPDARTTFLVLSERRLSRLCKLSLNE
ncbi:hypothetical protein HSB1_34250 [Halogranum salarium B-1]|uniref:Uncharacterized protein n=1 Tax=Halogranum salarium B-1 TaxID=1210908 RepID=J2ZYB1_9EURY|nr:hypothetical protein HSB1_34250 [Halogranum salarium B-1]